MRGLIKALLGPRWAVDSFWVIAGNVTAAIASLAAVRLITSLCSPADYGTASLVLALVAFASGGVIGPVMVVHLRIYFDYVERDLTGWFVRTFNIIVLAGAGVVIAGYGVVAYSFERHGKELYLVHFWPAALLILAQAYLSSRTNYLEGHRAQQRLAYVTIVQRAAYPILVTWLLITHVSGATAILFGQLLAVLLAVWTCWASAHSPGTSRVGNQPGDALRLIREFIDVGWSLPLGYLAAWGLSSGDRFLIDYFLDVRHVGIYAVNYGVWSVPYLMLNGCLEMITRPIIYGRAAKGDWVGVSRIVLLRVLTAVTFCALGTVIIAIWGPALGGLLIASHYQGSRALIILVAVAHCFFVLAYSLLPIFLARMEYPKIVGATLIAVAANLGSNVALIPRFGLEGAAASSLVSYFILATVVSAMSVLFLKGQAVRWHTVFPGAIDLRRAALRI